MQEGSPHQTAGSVRRTESRVTCCMKRMERCAEPSLNVFRGHLEHVLAIGHFLLTSSTPLVVI